MTKTIDNENLLNRIVRVFISSTFRDMESERNHLMTVVFPKVKRYCQEKDVEFVPLDLRWGITDEQSESGHVAEVCLKEINNSRPFFIGLLGERYGWQPGQPELERNPDLKLDFPFIEEDFCSKNLSVTEVEMQFGVLRYKGDPLNAAFWFRSKEMPTSPDFCEKSGSPEADKFERLKNEIREQKTYPVGEYKSVEDLGNQIYDTLIVWIDTHFPEGKTTWLEKQTIEQSSFERSRKRLYVPRQSDFDALDAFLDSDKQGLSVTGLSGMGKSALLANWMDDYQKRNANVCFLTHYVSASVDSDSPLNILRRLTEMLDPEAIEPESTPNLEDYDKKAKTLDDRRTEFAIAVGKYLSANENQRLVIVLDGMNQLNPVQDAKNFEWFPILPDSVKVICSTIESDETRHIFTRLKYEAFFVAPLTPEQRKQIIVDFLAFRGRKLKENQITRIASDKESASPLVLRTLLDELCVFGSHEKLDDRINWYLSAASQEEFFDRVLECLETDYGPEETRTILTALIVARYGLSESELLGITGYNPLTISTILCAIDSHIVNHSGQYEFGHAIIRSAAMTRYESSIISMREREIAFFLSDQNESFSRQCMEVPWQYQTLDRWDDLNSYLLNFAVMDELYNRTLNCDFCKYWGQLFKRNYTPHAYFKLDITKEELPVQCRYLFRLAHFGSLFNNFDITERSYSEVLTIRRGLAEKFPGAYQPNLTLSLNNLGLFLTVNGCPDLAEAELNEALTIYRNLEEKYPETYRPDVALTLYYLGLLHTINGPPDQAKAEYNEALTIYRDLAKKFPKIYRPGLAMMLYNLGNLHTKNGRPDLAETEFNEALTLYRDLAENFSEVYRPKVATILHNLGGLHTDNGRPDLTEAELNEALTVRRDLAEKYPEVHRPNVAETLNNLGGLHADNGRPDLAEAEFNEALTIRRDLAEKYPEVHRPYVAMILHNLGGLHKDNGRPDLAETEFNEALTIYRELAEKFPETYRSDVALTLNNLGVLHRDNGRPDLAETEYNEALTLYRELAEKFPETYRSYVAMTLNGLGNLHCQNGRPDLAEAEFNEALTIYRDLAEKCPDAYRSDVAMTIHNLGNLHSDNGRLDLAEAEYNKALTIYRELTNKFPDTYRSNLAITLYNLGILHADNGRLDLAETEYNEALAIYRELAEKFPDTYRSNLALTLNNLGILHRDNGRPDLAETEYNESLTIYRELAEKCPGVYRRDVAMTLNNLGILHADNSRPDLAEAEFNEALTIYRELAEKFLEVYRPYVADTAFNLSMFYTKINRKELAINNLEEAREIYQELANQFPESFQKIYQTCLRLYEKIQKS